MLFLPCCIQPCSWQGNEQAVWRSANCCRYYVKDCSHSLPGRHRSGGQLPAQASDRHKGRQGMQLQGPSGEHIDGFGRRQVQLRFGNLHFSWNFLVAAARNFKLAIDIQYTHAQRVQETIKLCHATGYATHRSQYQQTAQQIQEHHRASISPHMELILTTGLRARPRRHP